MVYHRLFLLMVLGIVLVSCQNESSMEPGNETISISDTIQLPEKTTVEPAEQVDYDTTKWTELKATAFRQLDFRYATSNNFLKEPVYECGRCFLRPDAAKTLLKAEQELQQKGMGLILYDCYRPRPIQYKMWEILPDKRYVSDPNKGSMHNRGLAVDLGLIDNKGKLLDMGTDFDYFGPEAWHEYEQLDSTILANRKLLKTTMEKHGFKPIRTEWWHYSYQLTGGALSDYVWGCPGNCEND